MKAFIYADATHSIIRSIIHLIEFWYINSHGTQMTDKYNRSVPENGCIAFETFLCDEDWIF